MESDLITRALVIVGFLLCITVIAELADRIGVFDAIAHWASRMAQGSVLLLWLLVVALSIASTVVLSLDTTAVLVTPVVLALAAQLGLDRAMFAYTTVWLANTASLLLPVSNLTNLLAWQQVGSGAGTFPRLMWPAALTVAVLTVVALALLFARSLRGRYVVEPRPVPQDRLLLNTAMIICLLLGPALVLTGQVLPCAAVAAGALLLLCLIRDRSLLSWALVPWKLILVVVFLFSLAQVAHLYGLGEQLLRVVGEGDGLADLLRLAGLSALGANLVNNLPAYLAFEPVTQGSAVRMSALLVGVGAGPLISPWASLATLLWASRVRAAGVSISWRRFALRGLILAPILVAAGTAVQFLTRG